MTVYELLFIKKKKLFQSMIYSVGSWRLKEKTEASSQAH